MQPHMSTWHGRRTSTVARSGTPASGMALPKFSRVIWSGWGPPRTPVSSDPFGPDRLGDRGASFLQVPAEHHLSRGLAVARGDRGDDRVVEGAGPDPAVAGDAADRRPGLGADAVDGVRGLHGRLGEVRVHLDLVDRGDHRRLRQQHFQVPGHEVADADRPHPPVGEQGLQCAIGLLSEVEPAYIRNGRLDILTGNALARALFAPIFTSPARPPNAARFTFLDPAAAEFYPDWDAVADQNVASLRAEVGRNPYDKPLSDLIGELSTRGDTFRQRWARHEVQQHRAGAKRLNHPLVGPMTFTYETMELAADQGLFFIVCSAAPGSRDADALNLLASWHATGSAEDTPLKQT
jgi:MmyB-like transcription regulator ligand binding domain